MLKPAGLKIVLAATAFLALAGSTFVYAQQGFGGHGFGYHGDGGPGGEHWRRPSVADVNAFADARIAALKAGLELTPDQTKNWPPFEQALRDRVQLRIQRMQAREARQAADQPAPAPTSPFDRLAHRADAMAKTSAALKKIADTGAPLYASLTDDQKGRFVALAHLLRPHHPMHGFMDHGGAHGEFGQSDGHGWGHNGGHGGPGDRMQDRLGEDGDHGSKL
ncbi:MAG: Spy/CpxP family protein refolding chaperone [Xanthobacteraceae bacterium]|jgi:hypothetical protein